MTRPAVVVPDYGCGNLAAVQRMCERIGKRCDIVQKPEQVALASRVILAGVGAFDHGMTQLRERGFIEPIAERWRAGVPVLGICLGMQLLCRGSEEGVLPGLAGWRPTYAASGPTPAPALKVPHMGWSTLKVQRDNPLLPNDGALQRFYFVHSYHVVCDHEQTCSHAPSTGRPSSLRSARDNLFGVQFHPEKSHRFGMGAARALPGAVTCSVASSPACS